MVIAGNSIGGSTFDGVLAERATDSGCCPEALAGEGRACNKPAEITYSAGVRFVPGSANGDGRLDIADGIFILNALFRGGRAIPCMKAADANGDCQVDATDAVYIIYYQFLDGPAPVNGIGCQVISNDVCPDLPCDVQESCQA
ncbi:MAG TPA: hypothetical protein DCM87_15175 [Planctomycetes bacterium]|nr:hypothetical protein [Planctomycetota bacterium]